MGKYLSEAELAGGACCVSDGWRWASWRQSLFRRADGLERGVPVSAAAAAARLASGTSSPGRNEEGAPSAMDGREGALYRRLMLGRRLGAGRSMGGALAKIMSERGLMPGLGGSVRCAGQGLRWYTGVMRGLGMKWLSSGRRAASGAAPRMVWYPGCRTWLVLFVCE